GTQPRAPPSHARSSSRPSPSKDLSREGDGCTEDDALRRPSRSSRPDHVREFLCTQRRRSFHRRRSDSDTTSPRPHSPQIWVIVLPSLAQPFVFKSAALLTEAAPRCLRALLENLLAEAQLLDLLACSSD